MDVAAPVRKRIPNFESITISGLGKGETYASVMKKVMDKVKLEDISR